MAGRHVKGMRAASDSGFLVVIAGAVLLVGGAITYVVVSTTLGEQEITVSDDADAFAGQKVTQPWRPYAQANAIADRATKVAGGKMYSELPQDDPNRQTVMICFVPAGVTVHLGRRLGVAVLAAGLGVVFILIGVALRAIAGTMQAGEGSRVTAGPPVPLG
jgi:hypothetical protein